MVLESPARLIGHSHKRQKDFHLTLRTLTEAYKAFAAATNGGQAKPLPLFEMASVLVPGDLPVIAMHPPIQFVRPFADPELKHSPNSTQPLLRLSAIERIDSVSRRHF